MQHYQMSRRDAAIGEKFDVFQLALLLFTIIVFCALVVDTVSKLPKELSNLIHFVDTFARAAFFFDFCVRFHRPESKTAFKTVPGGSPVDMVKILPKCHPTNLDRAQRHTIEEAAVKFH